MCKPGAMMWALPALPMIAMMRMAERCLPKDDCDGGAPRGADGGCDRGSPGADWAITVKKQQRGKRNIVDTAISTSAFKTLTAALEAAGLVEVLQSEGPFTVFAPTDDAFARLPAGALDALLRDKRKLEAVLKYHVLSGELSSDDLRGVATARTLEGTALPVESRLGIRVGSAPVIKADIGCANGVIHAIDAVLLPE